MTLLIREYWAVLAFVAAALVAAATASPTPPSDYTTPAPSQDAAPAASDAEFAAPSFGSWAGPRAFLGPIDAEEEPGDHPITEGPRPSPPRVVRIPTIEIEASIIDLGLTNDGALETPKDFDLAGWWAGGTPASHPGPTVIVGHVDSTDGPAVFFRLRELEPGDVVEVVDDHDRVEVFVVVERQTYDKNEFPTERVYGDTDGPTLRLITCGGVFDRSERSYESNVVVFAEVVPKS